MNTRRPCATAALVAAVALDASAAPAAITPSGATVPENLLRIELHLARPLARPLAMDRVRLVDAHGETIAGAFLDLPLPSADGRTVTLLLHPGRVKNGVGANLALGRALHAGDDVALVVDDPQLATPLRHRWHVTSATALDPGHWRVQAPRAGTRVPLQLALDATVDASSARLIALRGPDGERVDGSPTLIDGEKTWRFEPARPWRAGRYEVVVHPLLEDVAGNRACTPFEAADLSEKPCAIDAPGFDLRR